MKKWFLVVSSVPWLLLIVAYVEALLASYVLGRWPRPMLDDPKYIPTAPLHLIFQLLFVAFVPAFFLLIFMTRTNRTAVRVRSIYSVGWTIFVLGAIAVYLLNSADPGNVWYWLFD